jgi:hypothetical protein
MSKEIYTRRLRNTIFFNIIGKQIRKVNGSTTIYNTTECLNTVQLAAVLYALKELAL